MPDRQNEGIGRKGLPRRRRSDIGTRTEQAFRVYLELLDTAAWFRYQVDGQLAQFDLNMERFRLLALLYREGPMTVAAITERRCCTKQSLFELARRLAERGFVKLEVVRLPAVEADESRISKAKRQRERRGRRAVTLRLTEEGKKFMAVVMRRHAKLVYAFMRAVNPRAMENVSRACRKIREGDPFKLIHELMMEDVE